MPYQSRKQSQFLPLPVREGMLPFLTRLPDNSVSILAIAIDNHIISSEMGEEVTREIERGATSCRRFRKLLLKSSIAKTAIH